MVLACPEYKKLHGVDVSPLLEETAVMSEEVSDLEVGTATEQERQAYKEGLVAALSLTVTDREMGIKVWEVIRPEWRSEEVS